MLPENFANFNFIRMSKREANPKNRIRLIAMAHIQEGKTLSYVASSLKVHWNTIQTWLRKFRNHGISGLYVKVNKPKQGKISEINEKWIADFISALNAEDTGGYITGRQLHRLVEQEFSIKCCLRTIYNTLHKLNFSWISSRSKHPKSDEEIQLLYKKISRTSTAVNTTTY